LFTIVMLWAIDGWRPLNAQLQIELTPFVGSFLPLRDWGGLEEASATSTFRQTIGVLIGGRLRFEPNDIIGFELGGSYVNTGWIQDRQGTSATAAGSQVGISLKGNMTIANARLTFKPRRGNFYLLAGAGYMTRGGRAWDEDLWPSAQPTVYEKSNVSGIIGTGLRAAASPSVLLDVSVEVHLHGTERVKEGFAFVNSTYEGKGLQSDFILTVGVPITLKRR
jgi:hypothetical protein